MNDPSTSMPRLTIGLPVYNGAATLARSLDRLLAQSFENFVLILHDNASTDATAEICAEYAKRDQRVQCVRNASTVSWNENFRRVLNRAVTSYFMWATHDDLWDRRFAEANIAVLDANPEAVCCVSKVVYFVPGGASTIAPDTAPLTGTPATRIRKYLAEIAAVARLYGVYRTATLQRSFPEVHLYGTDWLVVALTLLEGDHLEVDEILLWRERARDLHYERNFGRIDQFEPTARDWFLPMRRFNAELLGRLPPDVRREILPMLIYLNLRMTMGMREARYPVLRPLTWPLRRLAAMLLHERWRKEQGM